MTKRHIENCNDGNQPDWRMTVDDLKSCEGFNKISDEEAEATIESMVHLVRTIYQIYLSINLYESRFKGI